MHFSQLWINTDQIFIRVNIKNVSKIEEVEINEKW
jgi:hypothetical protein